MTIKRTMKAHSYGINNPAQLLDKLIWEGEKLTHSPHEYDVFNFIITAAVLAEWIEKYYSPTKNEDIFSAPNKSNKTWKLPQISPEWITDTKCLPNKGCDFNRHITNALSICAHTANASKHFHWKDNGAINAIGENPPITDYYQYFFTSTAKDLYLDFNGENYGLQQIKGILIQFYTGLINHLETMHGS